MMASAETGEPAIGDWELARNVSEWIEVVAILVIAIAVLVAVEEMVRSALRGRGGAQSYAVFKTYFSRGVLLGLDLLIAADIIRTVTLEQTFENVAALGLLVIVRTFLAWSIELEADGRWPWQEPRADTAPE